MSRNTTSPRGLPARRQREMARFLRTRTDSVVDHGTLAARFEVSEQTVRRDLRKLEAEGVVQRTFGGAIVHGQHERTEPAFHTRETREAGAKHALAQAALQELSPGEGLFLDASSTVLFLARALPRQWRGDAATAGLPALAELAARPEVRLTVLGGEYQRSSNCIRGDALLRQLRALRFDTAVISARAVHPQLGLCEADPEEAALKRAVVAISRRVLVLVDHTKLHRTAAHHYADLDDVSVLLTDAGASDDAIADLRKATSTPIRASSGSPPPIAAGSNGC